MATTSFVDGRLRVTHSDAYRTTSARTRSIDLTTAGDVDALIVNTLRRNGFDAVHRVVVAPSRTRGRATETPPGTAVHGMAGLYAARTVLKREFGITELPKLAP